MVVPFDGVDVFSGMVSNSTEDVNLFVEEGARAMVVSSNIEIWHLEPKINIGVVHLSLHLRIVLLLSRASDHYKLVSEPNSGVAVSWVLHAVSLHKVVAIIDLDLKEVVECVFILLVVTSSDQVELALRTIDALEIVGELMLVLDFHLLAAKI